MRIRQARWQRKLFLLFHLNKLERVITTSLKWGHGDKEGRENNVRGTESFVAWRSRIFFSKAATSRYQRRCCLSSNRYSCVCARLGLCINMRVFVSVWVCLSYLWQTFLVLLRCEMLRCSCHAEQMGFGPVRESERKLYPHFLTMADRVLWSTNCISYTMLVTTAEKIHRRSHRYHQLLKQQKIEPSSEENKQINK